MRGFTTCPDIIPSIAQKFRHLENINYKLVNFIIILSDSREKAKLIIRGADFRQARFYAQTSLFATCQLLQ